MPQKQPIFCSVIIPTIGRSTLSRAVHSVLDQNFQSADFEVIVVNDSGQPLPVEAWQQSDKVTVLNTNRRERSFARNAGAAIARGEYLGFLDDDDWLLPGVFDHFWDLSQRIDPAAWLYGGIQIVEENGNIVAEMNSGLEGNCCAQILGGAWAPIQASLISAEAFFEAGGYDPSICGTEDEDLCRRIALRGSFANIDAPVACLLRGQNWQTSTNYLRAPADTRISRDRVINETGSFSRIAASARSDPNRTYWYGRILKVCVSTVILNLRRKSLAKALSRIIFTARWLGVAGSALFSKIFWDAFVADHASNTLHFVHMAMEQRAHSQ
jgi:glycosyltransferase involved in cell wall biosynthesis